MRTVIGIVALCCAGCSSFVMGVYPLTKSAAAIAIVQPDQVSGCELLAYLGSEQYGDDYLDASALIKNAGIDLRNQAAQLGATHLVLDPPQINWHWAAQAAQAFRCGDQPKEAKDKAAEDTWEMKSWERMTR
jgi:hypothetical protein